MSPVFPDPTSPEFLIEVKQKIFRRNDIITPGSDTPGRVDVSLRTVERSERSYLDTPVRGTSVKGLGNPRRSGTDEDSEGAPRVLRGLRGCSYRHVKTVSTLRRHN